MKGGLGLLAANAISHNMRITLAAGMLNEPEVHPTENMTEEEIDSWVQKDLGFSWFKTLSDEVLIKVMDRLHSSVNPAPFFRLVIDAKIPNMKDGDLYYPVLEFTTHADKWINALSDLIKGGWNEKSTDLKQVFLSSVISCQLVHDQAKREMHQDVLRLIATLKKWIIVQDNDIQDAKAAKDALKSKLGTTDTKPSIETDKSFEKRVRALFTAMQAPNTQAQAAGLAAGQDKTTTGPMWQCPHCGNEWRDDAAKPPRCKKECVYHEHKDFNKTEKYPKGAKPLSWKAYGEPYPPKQQAFFDKRDVQKGAYTMNLKPEGRRK
jgi:rubrerythrin